MAAKTLENFIAQSPVGERLLNDKFKTNLAGGALRLVVINGEPQTLRKLGNNEAKIAETLEHSSLFGILASNPEFIQAEIDQAIMKPENVPESYFKLQQKIAREQGYGVIDITNDMRQMAIETIRNDQQKSLEDWANYLRDASNENTYPDWFKVYAWQSMLKLGEFVKPHDDEKTGKHIDGGYFEKRSKSTTALFADLNPEALAYVYDAIDSHVLKGKSTDDEKLAELLKNANFGKLYGRAMLEATPLSPERREIAKGSWVKYDQIEGYYDPDYETSEDDTTVIDNETAMRLASSLRGHGTGWCTAGTKTAAYQLSAGDFYVYYSEDEDGKDTIPRVAIRMENGRVAEVRGIEEGQNLEGTMNDIVIEKLQTLPGSDEYATKVENMRRVTEIDERVKGGGELTVEDILFLRFSGRIQGFGWGNDPRVEELLDGRDFEDDLKDVLKSGADPTALITQLIDMGAISVVAESIDKFVEAGADIDPTALADRLMGNGDLYAVAKNLDKFVEAGADIDPADVVNRVIYDGLPVSLLGDVINGIVKAGVDPTALADRVMHDWNSRIVAKNLDKFVEAGADRECIEALLGR